MRVTAIVVALAGCRKHERAQPDRTPVVASAAPSPSIAPSPPPRTFECRNGVVAETTNSLGLDRVGSVIPASGDPISIDVLSPKGPMDVVVMFDGRVPSHHGLRNEDIVRAACARHIAAKTCVARARIGKPDLVGRAELELSIENGVVAKIDVGKDSLGDRALTSCVIDALKAATVGSATGTATYEVDLEVVTAPRIDVREVTAASGKPAKEAVQRITRAAVPSFRACFDRAFVKNKRLRGNVTFSYMIDPQGAATALKFEDKSSLPPDVRWCVDAAVREMSFSPADAGGLQATTSIDFDRAG